MFATTRLAATAVTVLAVTAAVTSCGKEDDSGERDSRLGQKAPGASASTPPQSKELRMGQPSATQPPDGMRNAGEWTVTPQKAVTGTPEDMANSGLTRNKAGKDEPKVPVFVWSTLHHTKGGALKVRTMKRGLLVRTDEETRTKELQVLVGNAKWRGDCPPVVDDMELKSGQQVKICTVYLIPEGEKAEAVEIDGYSGPDQIWPVKA